MNIDLTDREIELLMMCVGTNIETIKQRHAIDEPEIADLIEELFELETDLREILHRQDDDWGAPGELVICDAETRRFNANAGTEARDKMKEGSRAAERRALKFVPPGPLGAKASRPTLKPRERSEVQDHDVWNKPPNDPVDW
jgi:hypothetical protein